jgi:sugar lactone lactonase YvrE
MPADRTQPSTVVPPSELSVFVPASIRALVEDGRLTTVVRTVRAQSSSVPDPSATWSLSDKTYTPGRAATARREAGALRARRPGLRHGFSNDIHALHERPNEHVRLPKHPWSSMRQDAISATVALRAAAELGEGPVWDAAASQLIWVDIIGRAVHFFDPETGEDSSVAVPEMPGVAIPRQAGGLVLAIGHGFGFLGHGGDFEQLTQLPHGAVTTRMNDGNCDSAGRLWAGTMGLNAEPQAGALYRLDPDLTVTRVLDGVTESNGIDWSPDDRLMYYVDSMERRVDVFDYDRDSGAVANRRPFAAVDDGDVLPDGLTVDDEGGVWVACWGGAAVRRFAPDGSPAGTVSLPASNITSPAFGGPALDRLFVTSARAGLSEEQLSREPDAGAVFVCRPGVGGRPQRTFAG